MGCMVSKLGKEEGRLRSRIAMLEEEMREMKCKREQESKAYEECRASLKSKELEWRRERERHKEEFGAMKRKLERESTGKSGWEKDMETCFLMEQMRVEQERREKAVEKWKQLYIAIKSELDELIRRTRQGEGLCWASEEVINVLQRELKAREEMLEALRVRLAEMEKERVKRDREIDILRQSLRILSATTKHNRLKTLYS